MYQTLTEKKICTPRPVVLKVCGAAHWWGTEFLKVGGQVTWQKGHAELMFKIGITFMVEKRNLWQLR